MRTGRVTQSRAISFLLSFVLVLAPLLACAATNGRVVVITIDGLAAFYLRDRQAPLPTLRRLAAEGAVAQALHVSNPATTWPNHTALVTGVD